ncbi:MAG: hypothetical protein ACLQDV_06785 [Candidatus Binataceae bacterium]
MRTPAALRLVVAVAILFTMAGCATTTGEPTVGSSVQTLEYYPFQVKGYQGSYPTRTALVLVSEDDRDFSGTGAADHAPLDGKPAIGATIGQDGQLIQRLYADPLGPTVQKAIAGAAQEAGMIAQAADYTDYTPSKVKGEDYVIASQIKRCWVNKRRGPDGRYGPVWSTAADFAVTVIVFKPPFSIPFWQGTLQSTYNDPPVGSFGLGPEDEAGIYDEPGEVLSVAMTRAVAGIFQRNEFRTLVMQDPIRPPQ